MNLFSLDSLHVSTQNNLTVFAAGFFGFPTWYEYLGTNDDGSVSIDNINDLWLIGASLLEMIIRLAALLAIGLVIFNGAKMMVSQGSPERVASARDGLLKSSVGLVITVLSANLVAYVASAFTEESSNNGLPLVNADASTIQTVLSYVFAVIGGLSVMVVIIGGIRYIVSAGDPQRISTSKNTILYAIIGLVISVSAYIIVNFVLNAIQGGPA